jgi:glycosyltransferase involved in cell wall biosynthesis
VASTKVLVVGAYPDSVVAFRGDLIRNLVESGCTVTVMAAPATPNVAAEIESLGVRFQPFPVARNSLNPRKDWQTLRSLKAIFRDLQPDAILAYTIKPIIWGAIAARVVPQARFVALVTGLGYAFQAPSMKRRLLNHMVVRLYWFALRRADAVVFQNSDNRDEFLNRKIVSPDRCHVVNGSGVNLEHFELTPLPPGPPDFLLIARLLGEKGIREYVAAARRVKQTFPEARFSLVGPTDPSPDGIPLNEVQRWVAEGIVEYRGATTDVRPFISDCHVYCLPSYHEGMPRTVLEAMAMGRPILTTDVSGCRQTVEPGVNGWLVPHGNATELAQRMMWFIENRDRWESMGAASRKIVSERFDVRKINAAMLGILQT